MLLNYDYVIYGSVILYVFYGMPFPYLSLSPTNTRISIFSNFLCLYLSTFTKYLSANA